MEDQAAIKPEGGCLNTGWGQKPKSQKLVKDSGLKKKKDGRGKIRINLGGEKKGHERTRLG